MQVTSLMNSVFAAMELALRLQVFSPKDHPVQTAVTEALRTCMNSPMENNVKTYNECDPGLAPLSPSCLVDPSVAPTPAMGFYFGLPLDLQLFRVCVSLIRQYSLLCVQTHSPLLYTKQIVHCVSLAAGCGVKTVSNSVVPLLPFLATLDATVPSQLHPAAREEYLSQLAGEIQVQHEVPLFDLLQLERLAPYLPAGQERVSVAVLRCLGAIRAGIGSLHTVNVGLFSVL